MISPILRVASVVALLLALAVPAQAEEAQGVVNVNTATVELLQLLPRIGPSTAARIVEFRSTNGNFKTVADLMLVRGIGEKSFELIEKYVTVSGKTTLATKVTVAKSDEKQGG